MRHTANKQIIEILKSLPVLESNLAIAKMRVEMIEKALSVLSEREKDILCRLIIREESPEDVAFDFHIERSELYRIRQIALGKFEAAMFGNPENCLLNGVERKD